MSAESHSGAEIFLIRHAQSANNAQDESQRVCDPHLTEFGHQQARRAAEFLAEHQFESLLTSAFRRALQTSHYFREVVGLVPEIVVDIHEHGGCFDGWHAGNFQGMPGLTSHEISEEFGEVRLPDDYPSAGWWESKEREDHDSSKSRAIRMSEYLKMRTEVARNHILCVTHADFLGKLLLAMLGDSIRELDEFYDLKNTGVSRLTVQQGEWKLVALNSVHFLPDELVTS